jgi:hypothetical protein
MAAGDFSIFFKELAALFHFPCWRQEEAELSRAGGGEQQQQQQIQ